MFNVHAINTHDEYIMKYSSYVYILCNCTNTGVVTHNQTLFTQKCKLASKSISL